MLVWIAWSALSTLIFSGLTLGAIVLGIWLFAIIFGLISFWGYTATYLYIKNYRSMVHVQQRVRKNETAKT